MFTDATAVNLLYIAKVTDPTQFDSLLLHAVAMKLASEIAEALTGRAELRDRMLSKYLQILAEARGVDSQERKVNLMTHLISHTEISYRYLDRYPL